MAEHAYLGVTIYESKTFRTHVDEVVSKARDALHKLRWITASMIGRLKAKKGAWYRRTGHYGGLVRRGRREVSRPPAAAYGSGGLEV